jgi:hypothetical protein
MGRHQPQIQRRQPAQQHRPDHQPPQPARQQEPEDRAADRQAPPAGHGHGRTRVRHVDRPRRRSRALGVDQREHGEADGGEQADGLGEAAVPPLQGRGDRPGGRLEGPGREQGSLDELAEVRAQALLHLPLHEDEQAHGDKEPRPDTGSQKVGFVRERAERVAGREAQQERHAPGQPDEHGGPDARAQRVLAQQPEPLLQLVERPAARHQEFADIAIVPGHGVQVRPLQQGNPQTRAVPRGRESKDDMGGWGGGGVTRFCKTTPCTVEI